MYSNYREYCTTENFIRTLTVQMAIQMTMQTVNYGLPTFSMPTNANPRCISYLYQVRTASRFAKRFHYFGKDFTMLQRQQQQKRFYVHNPPYDSPKLISVGHQQIFAKLLTQLLFSNITSYHSTYISHSQSTEFHNIFAITLLNKI